MEREALQGDLVAESAKMIGHEGTSPLALGRPRLARQCEDLTDGVVERRHSGPRQADAACLEPRRPELGAAVVEASAALAVSAVITPASSISATSCS